MNGRYMSARRKRFNPRFVALLSSLVLIIGLAAGVTMAYLIDETDPVTNTFTPPTVTVDVHEDFNGTVKSNVTVTNTSDIDVFVRVKLVSYFVDEGENIVGKTASVPDFELGEGWFEMPDGSNTYYYKYELEVGEQPEYALIGDDGITLKAEDDVYRQVVEVMAEAIQADGVDGEGHHPVEVWGVKYVAGDPATDGPATISAPATIIKGGKEYE